GRVLEVDQRGDVTEGKIQGVLGELAQPTDPTFDEVEVLVRHVVVVLLDVEVEHRVEATAARSGWVVPSWMWSWPPSSGEGRVAQPPHARRGRARPLPVPPVRRMDTTSCPCAAQAWRASTSPSAAA